jgi:hypothetical protein
MDRSRAPGRLLLLHQTRGVLAFCTWSVIEADDILSRIVARINFHVCMQSMICDQWPPGWAGMWHACACSGDPTGQVDDRRGPNPN